MTRLALVGSIAACTVHASRYRDWRELELNTTYDGEVIAKGGYREFVELTGSALGNTA